MAILNADGTVSVESAVRGAFPFDVAKFPLQGPDNMATPHYGMFRSDNGVCVGMACKKGYEPHTTDDIVTLAEAAFSAFDGGCKVNGYWREGHYLTIAPSDSYRRNVFGKDSIWPRLVIRAGYDGKPFSASLGFYRDACKNLAILQTAGVSVSRTIRHCSKLRRVMPELVDTFRSLANSWGAVVSTAQEMDSRQVDLADFLRQVYPLPENATQRTADNYAERVTRIVRRILSERVALGRRGQADYATATAWEAFNGVQGYTQHDVARRGRNSELDSFGRAVLAIEDGAVQRAMELALAV
jgi:hypothetical protein